MPVDYSKYPKDWKQISKRIREREGQRCKWCAAPNHTEIVRSCDDPVHYIVFDEVEGGYTYPDGQRIRLSEIPDEYNYGKHIKVILTVAHLDHTPSNNDESNLVALCQRCHLRYDSQHHTKNAKATRAKKRRETISELGQLSLFDDDEDSTLISCGTNGNSIGDYLNG